MITPISCALTKSSEALRKRDLSCGHWLASAEPAVGPKPTCVPFSLQNYLSSSSLLCSCLCVSEYITNSSAYSRHFIKVGCSRGGWSYHAPQASLCYRDGWWAL